MSKRDASTSKSAPSTVFQLDHVGEFSSKLLATWFRYCGIVTRVTLTKEPKSNGPIERLHAAVWSCMRAVMAARGHSLSLWHAIELAVPYLRGRLLVTSLRGESVEVHYSLVQRQGTSHCR
jgi:hypothetical protein